MSEQAETPVALAPIIVPDFLLLFRHPGLETGPTVPTAITYVGLTRGATDSTHLISG